MREIRSEKSLGNIVQPGKRDVLRASAQSAQRSFHRRVAKHSIQSLANGRQNHARASGFHARGGSTFADFPKNFRGGITRDDGNGNDTASGSFYFFAAYDLIACPVPAFNQNVRKQSRNHLARRKLIENHHSIHAFERSENFGTLALRQYGAPGAFQLAHASIAIKAHDQHISKRARLLQAADVPGMQQIETAISEHNAAAIAFPWAKPQNRFVESQYLRVQRNSMKSHAKIALALAETLVYHAPRAKHLRAGRFS
jgi:hypothetical protein